MAATLSSVANAALLGSRSASKRLDRPSLTTVDCEPTAQMCLLDTLCCTAESAKASAKTAKKPRTVRMTLLGTVVRVAVSAGDAVGKLSFLRMRRSLTPSGVFGSWRRVDRAISPSDWREMLTDGSQASTWIRA